MNKKNEKVKKISALSALVLFAGLLGGSFAKQLEKTQLGQLIEKKLNIKTGNEFAQTDQIAESCVQQQDDDSSVLFVGCNGFF